MAYPYVPLGQVEQYLRKRGHEGALDDVLNHLHEGNIKTIADRYLAPPKWKPACPCDTPPSPCTPTRADVPAAYWGAYRELCVTEGSLTIRNAHYEVYDQIKLSRDDLDRIWPGRGPRPGATGKLTDQNLFAEIDKMIADGCRSPTEAARKLYKDKVLSGQSEIAAVKRLVKKYNQRNSV